MKLPFISDKEPQRPDSLISGNNAEQTGASCQQGGQEIAGLVDLYSPEEDEPVSVGHSRDVLDVLLELQSIDASEQSKIRTEHAREPQKDIVEFILENNLVPEDDVLVANAEMHSMPCRRINTETINEEAFNKLDAYFIRTNWLCPIDVEDETLVLATADPGNIFAVEEAKRLTGMPAKLVLALKSDIESLFEGIEQERNDYKLDDIISDMTDVEVVQEEQRDFEDLEKMAGQSPVIKFVNYCISNAIHEGASDVHIEPKPKNTRIRYRIDGVLFEMMKSPLKMHPALVSRIKIMANLDISERRLPQDGKVSVIVGGRGIDLRVSTLPTNHGEKVVIRILDSNSIMRGLDRLGMAENVKEAFEQQIAMPHGIMLVTGPTGSGKSTTLYSALAQMDGDTLNVSTVEDPVEYELSFCNQVHVRDSIGLSFAAALRSLLRQDPDVIMIGEIRDRETARIAVQAALTGHLVLSTLHTNDAPSSVTRLVNIGVDPYLIAASLNAILAQRLVRRICPKCKEQYTLPENIQKHARHSGIQPSELFHGKGCDSCRNSGYAGRLGIYEFLVIDEKFRDMINKDSSVNNMRQAFSQSGQASMFDDGVAKIKQGLTTLEEVLRVTQVCLEEESNITVKPEDSGNNNKSA